MPKDSVFSMAFGFPRSVSQLTTDVQQLSKECNSCNSNFNELRKEIRETQSAPPQASTKWITNLTKQKTKKRKKHKKHESRIMKQKQKSWELSFARCQTGKTMTLWLLLRWTKSWRFSQKLVRTASTAMAPSQRHGLFAGWKMDNERDDSLARSQSHPTEHHRLHHFHPQRRHGHVWNMCKFLVM